MSVDMKWRQSYFFSDCLYNTSCSKYKINSVS